MKNTIKIKSVLAAALATMALVTGQSCSKDKEQTASIVLEAPADNSLVYLEDGNVRFVWSTDAPVADGFSLILTGASEKQTKTYRLLPTAYSREIAASDLDCLLKEWGATPGGNFTLRWTVTPVAEGQGTAGGERILRVRVLP